MIEDYENVTDDELKILLDRISEFAFDFMSNKIEQFGGLTHEYPHEDGSKTIVVVPKGNEDVCVEWTECPHGRVEVFHITPVGLEIPRLIIPAPTMIQEQISIPLDAFTMKLEE